VSHKRIAVGHGTYGKNGTVKHRDDLSAKIASRSNNSISLRFSLDSAGLRPGKIEWRVVSGWTGDDCVQAPPPPSEPAPVAASGKNRCLDSVPNNGFEKGRINKLRVAGCTSPGGEFTHGPGGGKQVALTFDDGPSSYTESVLKILDDHGAHSTFFEIGEQVSAGATAARDILAQGSEIGNHSYHHENIPGYDSLKATSDTIERVTGFRPCEFRPPYGSVNSGLVDDANSLGMSTILWDIDTQDWTLPGSGSIYNSATNAGPGSIVLMHDGGGNRSETVAALPGIIENLQNRGLKLVTVTELLGGRLKLKEAH
jgi:peptidoglycan/xylan/chitin deacetylase (PgdA/CDA1 family)